MAPACTLPSAQAVGVELQDKDLIGFDPESRMQYRPGRQANIGAEGSYASEAATSEDWYAVCACCDWQSGPFRYQDQAERSANRHNCDRHMCAGCAYVPWFASDAERDQALDYYCRKTDCKYYNKKVPNNHRHWLPCRKTDCRDYAKHVSPGHKHWLPCRATRCRDYGDHVPPNHRHVYRTKTNDPA